VPDRPPQSRAYPLSGVGGLRRKAVVGQLNAVAESLNDHHPPVITRRLFNTGPFRCPPER